LEPRNAFCSKDIDNELARVRKEAIGTRTVVEALFDDLKKLEFHYIVVIMIVNYYYQTLRYKNKLGHVKDKV